MSQSDQLEETSSFEDWYSLPSDDLEQGDIFLDLPVIFPSVTSATDGTTKIRQKNIKAIILTQTCDIPKQSQTTLLVAEILEYSDLTNGKEAHWRSKDFRKSLARGTAISEFLLPPMPLGIGPLSWSVAIFRSLYITENLATPTAKADRSPSIRLNSPYKEHLSQSYARFMMRVGLPTTLSAFESVKIM